MSTVTAGHTKRVTVNAIILSSYCIGNAAGPFMWQARYKPRCEPKSKPSIRLHSCLFTCRNHIPWIVIGICYTICPIILLIIRFILARENKRRDAEPVDDSYDNVYIELVNEDGEKVERKVDKVSNVTYDCVRCGIDERRHLRL